MANSEDDLIATYFAPLVTHAGALGLKDDAAVIDVPAGFELVISSDALVENVHFFAQDPPNLIAQKALRTNLSDLAAKGAKPLGFTLTLALPHIKAEWLAGFSQGLAQDITQFNCALLGGDTVKSPTLMISISVFGIVPKGKAVRRVGAMRDEIIAVTGSIGRSALGLLERQKQLRGEPCDAALVQAYLLPQPRLEIIEPLLAFASSAMDISDGLLGDCEKLLKASKLGGEIEVAQIPFADAHGDLNVQLCGGDDYEILATFPRDKFAQAQKTCQARGLNLTKIGFTRPQLGLSIKGHENKFYPQNSASYSHF